MPSPLVDLALDLMGMCADLAGTMDPTPVSDGVSMLLSLGRGRWFDAAISGVSMIPYIGDLAKLGKLPRYIKTVEKAIFYARQSEKYAQALAPVMAKIERLLRQFPDNVPGDFARLRALVEQFMNENRVAKLIASTKPDIRRHFRFRTYTDRGYNCVEATGRLGVPGKVMKHRSQSAQHALSHGTGDHAGHLAGNQFGPPGDGLNLGLQNLAMNTYAKEADKAWVAGDLKGGNYLRLEKQWEEKLTTGTGIEIRVVDKYRLGESRPAYRHVEWTEISPSGQTSHHSLDFANTTTPASRAATGKNP